MVRRKVASKGVIGQRFYVESNGQISNANLAGGSTYILLQKQVPRQGVLRGLRIDFTIGYDNTGATAAGGSLYRVHTVAVPGGTPTLPTVTNTSETSFPLNSNTDIVNASDFLWTSDALAISDVFPFHTLYAARTKRFFYDQGVIGIFLVSKNINQGTRNLNYEVLLSGWFRTS